MTFQAWQAHFLTETNTVHGSNSVHDKHSPVDAPRGAQRHAATNQSPAAPAAPTPLAEARGAPPIPEPRRPRRVDAPRGAQLRAASPGAPPHPPRTRRLSRSRRGRPLSLGSGQRAFRFGDFWGFRFATEGFRRGENANVLPHVDGWIGPEMVH